MRIVIAIFALLGVAACETAATNQLVSDQFAPPTARTRIVLMRPDVHMSLITAGGLEEPRADWTEQAEGNIVTAFEQVLSNRGHDVVPFRSDIAAADAQNQLILLHDAVGASIAGFDPASQLVVSTVVPTKAEEFDWTLGADAVEVATAYDADLALFVTTYGSYASGGRVAAAVVSAALFGVAPPLGVRLTRASLVDLQTGEVVWMNFAGGGDPREQPGAQAIIDRVTADIPL